MNIIKIGNIITVVLDDGVILTKENCSKEFQNDLFEIANKDNFGKDDLDKVVDMMSPKMKKIKEEVRELEEFEVSVTGSKYLSLVGSSIYIRSISELSLPVDLAKEFLKAEKANDKVMVESYLNFWTLVSLNTDSRARMNLFWFLKKYGMTITKSGLFVAYRNVDIKKIGKVINTELTSFVSDSYIKIKKNKKSPSNFYVIKEDENYTLSKFNTGFEPNVQCLGSVKDLYEKLSNSDTDDSVTVYTDNYTKSMNITIGNIVSMDRDKCDPVQENTCSRGLNHVAHSQRNLCLN